MLVTSFALVMTRIGIVRCEPLMTVVVPWDILQASPKLPSQRRNREQACEQLTLAVGQQHSRFNLKPAFDSP